MPFLTILRKELVDALRDRRSWIIAIVVSLLSGPVVFTLIANFIGSIEEKAAAREVVMVEPERAPTLVNFLSRAGATVLPAPADAEAALRSGRLQSAVVVPPPDFEARWERGEPVTLAVLFDDSHDRAQPVVATTLSLLRAFGREAGTLRLVALGVSPQVLAPVAIEEQNLAPAQARGARLLFIVPWAALLVAVFGALPVAIDLTAGERERGSLEPLLMNPVGIAGVVLGKWAVVMLYSSAIVVLTLAGFLVSMRLVANETLSALMHLQWRELAIFAAVLLPFAALMAAANLLAATFGRSFKEAQTYVSYLAMSVQFAALVPVFLTTRDALWQLVVPSVAQLTVLMKVLRGEPIGAAQLLLPALVCALVAALALLAQARLLRRETVVFARS
jgi:sodium transport system permease protein